MLLYGRASASAVSGSSLGSDTTMMLRARLQATKERSVLCSREPERKTTLVSIRSLAFVK